MSCGLLLGLLVAIGGFDEVQAKAVVEIRFVSYSAKCWEHLGWSACDPEFRFCLTRPHNPGQIVNCYYGTTDYSGEFVNTNYINFDSMEDIKGINNPWILYIPTLKDNSILMVTKLTNINVFKNKDLKTWGTNLPYRAYPSKYNSRWTNANLKCDDYDISIQYRVYCQRYYSGKDCTTEETD